MIDDRLNTGERKWQCGVSVSFFVVRMSALQSLKAGLYCLFTVVLLSLAGPQDAIGQIAAFEPTANLNTPRFNLDWSQFRSDSAGLTRLEVYYKVTNSGLTFVPVDDEFEARYKITLRVFHDKKQVGYKTFKKTKTVATRERTRMYSDFVLNMAEFNLKHGKYRIVANFEDLNAGRSAKKDFKIKLNDFTLSKKPKLSGLEFLYSSRPGKEEDKFFRKGNIVAVPLVDRGLQGGEDGGPVLFYFEIYRGKDTTLNAIIETRITHQTQGLVYRDSVYVKMDSPESKELRSVNLREFVPGVYTIKLSLFTSEKRMKKNKPSFTREDAFSVNWSLLGKVRHDYETVVRQLETIATPEEREELKAAKTPRERIDAWKTFWANRDPSPGTRENEALLTFYARVRYANAHFSSPRRTGWKSDRGSVFLRQGIPDEVDDQPVSLNAGAYQIWYYYNVNGEPLRFVFLDEYGDEDFRLQYPYDGKIR